MGLLQKCKKRGAKETNGRFNSRKTLERFVIEAGQCNVKIKLIVEQSGASRKAVDRILKMNNVDNSHKNTAAIDGAKKMADLMNNVNRATVDHLKELIEQQKIVIAQQKEANARLLTRLEARDNFKAALAGPDWPDERRIDIIGFNGNTGEHYEFIRNKTS